MQPTPSDFSNLWPGPIRPIKTEELSVPDKSESATEALISPLHPPSSITLHITAWEESTTTMHTNPDLEHAISCSYAPLPDEEVQQEIPASRRRPMNVIVSTISAVFFLAFFLVLLGSQRSETPEAVLPEGSSSSSSRRSWEISEPVSRGVAQGVSEKTFPVFSGVGYSWTNAMLAWQRTAYHFQPQKNWINDPNGPMFYMGWYHLFYQYNPDSAVWGNITWGHAVSKDLIHWLYLPLAMVPDQWYDINGVWTGSATMLPNGTIFVLYTGSTNESIQVQNLAYPADLSDPLLLHWVKYPGNPVIFPPQGIGLTYFRDPTTAWFTPNDNWRVSVGSKVNTTGIALVYKTKDFASYDLIEGVLHAVPGTGMWECVDFYPVPITRNNTTSTNFGTSVKYVLKASLDDLKHDYYALGTYDQETDTWTPDNPVEDVGIGLRYDYGKYYASKTFYDQNKMRRILLGWVGETDCNITDLQKGWASLHSIPRVVVLDNKTGSNILQWPVEEVETLRESSQEFNKVKVDVGSVVPLDVIGETTQLDITAEFEIEKEALEGTIETSVGYNCSTSGGAAGRGALGPFGLLVLTDESLSEQTPTYFYLAKDSDGNVNTFFCSDESRSSEATDVGKQVYGSTVPVLDGEVLSMRLLIDHSIVEGFAQGGRTVITSRVYPTKAIYGAAKLFLFNNATGASITASLKIWQMNSAFLRPYSDYSDQ